MIILEQFSDTIQFEDSELHQTSVVNCQLSESYERHSAKRARVKACKYIDKQA